MNYLFSGKGLRILEALSFSEVLYAFDFDGTLAPIVEVPGNARIPDDTSALLDELCSYASVAVISGRSTDDLRQRLGSHIQHLIGNHGVEGLVPNTGSIAESKSICIQWAQQIKHFEQTESFPVGAFVENKSYSIALHYRKARNKRNARLVFRNLVRTLSPAPRLVPGKCVFNLIPPGGPHKGIALLEAMRMLKVTSSFYVGDDDTDEDVFSLPDGAVITARVGLRRASQAQFFLKRRSEINKLLISLIRFHKDNLALARRINGSTSRTFGSA